MAAIERKTKRYPTDLSDEEWEHIAPLLPAKRSRKPAVDLHELLNAIRYVTRSGGWRMLPKDFPPRQMVCWWFAGSFGASCA